MHIKATAITPGKTYRFDTGEQGFGSGTVKVTSTDYDEGTMYVGGFWHHDGGAEPMGQGWGAFDRDEMVTEI